MLQAVNHLLIWTSFYAIAFLQGFFHVTEEIEILNTVKKKTEKSFGNTGDLGRMQAQVGYLDS